MSSQGTIESLETRRLYSVTLDDGILNIVGTPTADHVFVSRHASDATKLVVKIEGVGTDYNLADVRGIRFDGGEGSDSFATRTDNGDFYVPATVFGGGGNDTLFVFQSEKTRIYGGDGDDHIYVRSPKRSTVYGEAGNDLISGGRNRDLICGGDGNDGLVNRKGADTLDGGAGDDLIDGGSDAELCVGGDGADRIRGLGGNDSLFGDAGDDILVGGEGNDELFGLDGDDDLIGYGDDDTLTGGAGNDDADRTLFDNRRADSGWNLTAGETSV